MLKFKSSNTWNERRRLRRRRHAPLTARARRRPGRPPPAARRGAGRVRPAARRRLQDGGPLHGADAHGRCPGR